MTATTQSIIEFLQSRASSNAALDSNQVISLVTELKTQINQLSVTSPTAQPGATTLLYSGMIGDGLHSGDVAEAIAATHPGQILTINQTEIGELLSSDSFQKHWKLRSVPKLMHEIKYTTQSSTAAKTQTMLVYRTPCGMRHQGVSSWKTQAVTSVH